MFKKSDYKKILKEIEKMEEYIEEHKQAIRYWEQNLWEMKILYRVELREIKNEIEKYLKQIEKGELK